MSALVLMDCLQEQLSRQAWMKNLPTNGTNGTNGIKE